MKKILITGGAGFIGSHLVDKLVESGKYEIIIYDNLEEQVHASSKVPPSYLNNKAKFINRSLLDYEALRAIIKQTDIIIHLGAMVAVAQSMYQIEKYMKTNSIGTANILDILVNNNIPLQKLIIASSNTVYGEGKYECNHCGIIFPHLRTKSQLEQGIWELKCPNCESPLKVLPCDETVPYNPSSIYAISKEFQERISMMIARTYNFNTTILRFFLVYGSRQSLSNPYTGVCGIFANRVLNNKPPIIYEDGLQTRDFIHVYDVCQAIILSIEKKESNGEIFNIGTNRAISIKSVAEIITKKLNSELEPLITNKFRVGDIRHCIADITKTKRILGFKPTIHFQDGIQDLLEWIKIQKNKYHIKTQTAIDELNQKGLIR